MEALVKSCPDTFSEANIEHFHNAITAVYILQKTKSKKTHYCYKKAAINWLIFFPFGPHTLHKYKIKPKTSFGFSGLLGLKNSHE